VIIAGVTAAILLAWLIGWLGPLERPVGDLLVRTAPASRGSSPPVVTVLIDDASVARLGPLPWPRARLAALIEQLRADGARAVVLDLLLSEPGDPAGDRALADALAAGPAVLAASLNTDGQWLLPTMIFRGAAGLAHAHAEIGPDGVVRGLSATKQAKGLSLPAMAVVAARQLDPSLAAQPGTVLHPAFRLRPRSIPRLRAAEVLTGHGTDVGVMDRVAFIGVSAAGAGDQFVTPVGPKRIPTPGVLVHAAASVSLVRGDLLTLPSPLAATVLAALLATVVSVRRRRIGQLRPFRLLAMVLALWGGAALLTWSAGVVLPVVSATAAIALATIANEGVESRLTAHTTDRLISELETGRTGPAPTAVSRGARGRLERLRRLQRELARHDQLQGVLLEGLEEGVVLWDRDGATLMANAAAQRLWGASPTLTGIMGEIGESTDRGTLMRNGHQLEISVRALGPGSGHLGVIRDVTAEHELEIRRREVQRLVSHELRTPLASIAGFGEMLERYELSREELDRVAGLIRGESERLQQMVSTFLDLERLSTDHWSDERAVLDLPPLVSARCELLEASARAREQHLQIELPQRLTVHGAEVLLARVIDNLVGNAIKYAGNGATIQVQLSANGADSELRVSDDGPGIATDALPRLFERFYRVPGRQETGSGLGLAFVREVAEWHGGTIEVASRPGEGSCFTVRLPIAAKGDDDAREHPGHR
jgi:signal transduction histidine kinase